MTTSKIHKRTTSTRGGKRLGAGRPAGSGRYGEPTKAIRVPESLIPNIQQILAAEDPKALLPFSSPKLPLYGHKIAAGFLSPADDHVEAFLDLNEHLIKNPAATFCVRVEGESMLGAGIRHHDLLIVDRKIAPQSGHVVIAAVNTELTVKRLVIDQANQVTLHPENEQYPVISIHEGMHFHILGVVTNVIHSLS